MSAYFWPNFLKDRGFRLANSPDDICWLKNNNALKFGIILVLYELIQSKLLLIFCWSQQKIEKLGKICRYHCYFLLKSKDCDSKKKTNKPFYFIKYTIKFENSFAMQRLRKKLLQSHDFNRLKKNKKSIFSVAIAQNPGKIWNRNFAKYDVIKTTWSGDVTSSWRKKHINTLQILLHRWRYKKLI